MIVIVAGRLVDALVATTTRRGALARGRAVRRRARDSPARWDASRGRSRERMGSGTRAERRARNGDASREVRTRERGGRASRADLLTSTANRSLRFFE